MNIKMLAGIMACVLITTVSFAQEEEKEKKKDVNTLEISNNGIKFKSKMERTMVLDLLSLAMMPMVRSLTCMRRVMTRKHILQLNMEQGRAGL